MKNHFSKQSQEVISFSRIAAGKLGNDFISTEHLLLGIIYEGRNNAVHILKNLHVDVLQLQQEVEMTVMDNNLKHHRQKNRLPLTKQAEDVIHATVQEATALNSNAIEPEHLLLAMLCNTETRTNRILTRFKTDYETCKNALRFNKK